MDTVHPRARQRKVAAVPDLVVLSLGAGVQSTALALLAEKGTLPKPDVAIFADTGWEPADVYDHLARLEAAVTFPVVRVQQGDIRAESIDPAYGTRLPLFVRQPDGSFGISQRQCTPHYKVRPIQSEIRRRLGASVSERPCRYCGGTGQRVSPISARLGAPRAGVCSVCHGTGALVRVGNPPTGKFAEQWIGFSTDEIGRVSPSRVAYARSRFPLLELDMSRGDCERWLRSQGWGSVSKSACIGCPFHGNRAWRELRDKRPQEWADAVEFDRQLRDGSALTGQAFLHRSGLPLDQAPIDQVSRREWDEAQIDLLDLVNDQLIEDGDPDGCSPYGCRSGAAS